MNTQRFFRVSGLALVAGGALSFGFNVVSAFFYGDTTTYANQPLYIISEYAMAAATVLLLLGIPGVYASRAEGLGVIGLVGATLLFISSVMNDVFGNLWAAMVEPWLATEAPKLAGGFGPPPFFAYYNVQELLLVVGSVLLAIPVLRKRVFPRWPGFVLLVSVVVGIPIYFAALPSSLASSFVYTLPTLLLLAAFVGLGYQTWSKPNADEIDSPAMARARMEATPTT